MPRIIPTAVVVALTAVFALAPYVQGQQAPPPTWKQGQPATMADSPLAAVAQPPAPKAPGEMPVDKLKGPAGVKVSLWAHGINNARVMAWVVKSTMIVSTTVHRNVRSMRE